MGYLPGDSAEALQGECEILEAKLGRLQLETKHSKLQAKISARQVRLARS